jgi:hypothetical protein
MYVNRRQPGSDDHGDIGLRIDAQEERVSVEGVRKVACPFFFLYTGLFGSPETEIIGSASCNL